MKQTCVGRRRFLPCASMRIGMEPASGHAKRIRAHPGGAVKTRHHPAGAEMHMWVCLVDATRSVKAPSGEEAAGA
eukprot:15475836-Alexandrium_andersonii.AAC.1